MDNQPNLDGMDNGTTEELTKLPPRNLKYDIKTEVQKKVMEMHEKGTLRGKQQDVADRIASSFTPPIRIAASTIRTMAKEAGIKILRAPPKKKRAKRLTHTIMISRVLREIGGYLMSKYQVSDAMRAYLAEMEKLEPRE